MRPAEDRHGRKREDGSADRESRSARKRNDTVEAEMTPGVASPCRASNAAIAVKAVPTSTATVLVPDAYGPATAPANIKMGTTRSLTKPISTVEANS